METFSCGQVLENKVEVGTLVEKTNPDISIHGAEANGIGPGLLSVAANHARGFGCALGTGYGNLSAGVALAVVEYLEKRWIEDDAGLGLTCEHVLD